MNAKPSRRKMMIMLGGAGVTALLAGCNQDSSTPPPPPPPPPPLPPPPPPPPPPSGSAFVGAVYAGTNKRDANTLAAFGALANGTLVQIAEYATGGRGGIFNSGNGLDPLISADSVITVDNRFVLAVNAGSNTIASLRVNADFSLTLIGTAPTGGFGPSCIAYRGGLVYVGNLDVDGRFTGEPDQIGNVTGFRFDTTTGQLTPIANSTRALRTRANDVEFSPDGRFLVVSGSNAGSTMIPPSAADTLVVYGVMADGTLTAGPQASAASTVLNTNGRNLPSVIGFEIVQRTGGVFVIATESREFQPNGAPGMLPMFQTGSVSTWRLETSGALTPVSQDVRTGPTNSSGPTSACWIVASPDNRLFWVASASGSTISTYRMNDDGSIALIAGRAAAGAAVADGPTVADGFIDLARNADGRFIYQLIGLKGAINVYSAAPDGGSLTLLQRTTGLLPMTNTQGIVFVARAA